MTLCSKKFGLFEVSCECPANIMLNMYQDSSPMAMHPWDHQLKRQQGLILLGNGSLRQPHDTKGQHREST